MPTLRHVAAGALTLALALGTGSLSAAAQTSSPLTQLEPTFITQTPHPLLTREQALSTLGTGLLKNATGTGVLSVATPGTDYLAPGALQPLLDAITALQNEVATLQSGLATANQAIGTLQGQVAALQGATNPLATTSASASTRSTACRGRT